jgi:alpha-L-fucosidase
MTVACAVLGKMTVVHRRNHASTAARTAGTSATIGAKLLDLGGAATVDVGFQYRRQKRTEELYEKDQPWRETPLVGRSSPGEFTAVIDGLEPQDAYEFRAVVKHPLLTVFGEDRIVPPSRRPS